MREFGALARLLPLAWLATACATVEAPERLSISQGADTSRSAHQSRAFATYKPFREQDVAPWAASNALALRLGGWKAFASGTVPDIPPLPGEGGEPRR